jgi:hypothetical protein
VPLKLTIQLAGGAGSYRKPHARPANFGFVAVAAQPQFLCGPISFNPRNPLDKRQSPQRTRKNLQRCIAVNNRTSRTLLLSPSSGVALLRSPSSSSTAPLGADGNASSDRGRRWKPCPWFALVHGRARGGRREWGP